MVLVAGVDEAGRGPIAGPVVAAAVILGAASVEGLADSKQLSPQRRELLANAIRSEALAWSVAFADEAEIEEKKILRATLAAMARQLGEGLLAMQLEPSMPYPGAFLSWVGVWHAWGNAQSQALSALATLLGDRRLGQAAEREARQFLARLVVEGLGHEFVLDRQTRLAVFPQIAYDVRCVALGLLGVAEATGDSNFAVAAGLAAGWLLGNNAAAQPMYDPATGRCYDGLDGPGTINRNSGAESTIEALFTLVEVANHPVARRYLTCLPATAPACPCPAGRTCRSFTNGTSAVLSVCFDHQALDFAVFRCTQTEAAAAEAEGHP